MTALRRGPRALHHSPLTARLGRLGATGLAICVGLGVLSGCTQAQTDIGFRDHGVPTGSFQLVAFDSCDEALTGLRAAAKEVVGPYGFTSGNAWEAQRGSGRDAAADPAPAGEAAKPATGTNTGSPEYSGTNTHESGVDEPDLVKTDGQRIVTISGGVLRVVEAASRRISGMVDLAGTSVDSQLLRYTPANLLLAGDHALVLMQQDLGYRSEGPDVAVPGGAPGAPQAPQAAPDKLNSQPNSISGPRFILVDLAGGPHVLASYRIDGSLVDARQVGTTARVVVRSSPHFSFPYRESGTDADRLKANRAIIDQGGIEQWLPRIEVSTGASTQQPQISCDAIARPAVYSGTSMLTVLSFDLAANTLADGRPTTLVADGDTVYSNGANLYVATDQRWQAVPMRGRAEDAPPEFPRTEGRTEIYKFDTTGARPTFVAGGSVPGYMINQYAMSEWKSNLRVATTRDNLPSGRGEAPASESAIYILGQDKKALKEIGRVEGLGKGERIYAVRFVGATGYVVTFRQVDPLYTVDLQDPQRPVVRGELKIPGYSAYLHPAGAGRLIGIGQNATNEGRVMGTQISLFDVANLAKPDRVAVHTLAGANSEAEFDPHAFLYWPTDGTLVVPLQLHQVGPNNGIAKPAMPSIGALVLRVSDTAITEVGFVSHPAAANNPGYADPIRRSLMIGTTLWTVSDSGLRATDATSLTERAWIPFN